MSSHNHDYLIILPVLPFNTVIKGSATVDTDLLSIELSFTKNDIRASWYWDGIRQNQVIERVPFRYSTWARCPKCGRKTWRLFASTGEGPFLCRKCTGIVKYYYWHQCGQVRQPKNTHKWLTWFIANANKIIGGNKNAKE